MTVFGYPPPNQYHHPKEHTMTAPRFRKYVDDTGQWRWSLLAGNGEIVASGEAYTRAADRDRSIDTLKRLMAELGVTETWTPDEPADHQAARQEFTRRGGPTDRNPDGPDEAA